MSDNEASDDDDGTSILPAEQFHTTVIGFRRLISSNINQFNHLDWTNISTAVIDELLVLGDDYKDGFDVTTGENENEDD
jgi:hypothetical protein